LIIEPRPFPRVGSPVSFSLDETTALRDVFVGAERISPDTFDFSLVLKDRHGLAWADFNGDERPDLLSVRGANLGLTSVLSEESVADELFLNQRDAFQRAPIRELGFEKRGCAARQVGLVDVNRDASLDIYIVCIRNTPNQLYLHSPDGRFIESASEVGLDIPQRGTFAWLDVEGDGDADLIWAGEDGVWLYRNNAITFSPERLSGPRVWVEKLAVGDYDRDGDGDVFAASKDQHLLYENTGETFSYLNPTAIGLPSQGPTANWLDFDNDGLLDLHAPPHGVYQQQPDGQFTLARALTATSEPLRSARTAWFDADNDGSRDVIIALEDQEKQWDVGFYRNLGTANHYLEVDLVGLPGNRPALGATVTVTTTAGAQTSGVGWAEGSHYGHGHYRVYFGLGPYDEIDSLVITWPDGTQQTLESVAADQILTVAKEP
jgi:hypothetical protein